MGSIVGRLRRLEEPHDEETVTAKWVGLLTDEEIDLVIGVAARMVDGHVPNLTPEEIDVLEETRRLWWGLHDGFL